MSAPFPTHSPFCPSPCVGIKPAPPCGSAPPAPFPFIFHRCPQSSHDPEPHLGVCSLEDTSRHRPGSNVERVVSESPLRRGLLSEDLREGGCRGQSGGSLDRAALWAEGSSGAKGKEWEHVSVAGAQRRGRVWGESSRAAPSHGKDAGGGGPGRLWKTVTAPLASGRACLAGLRAEATGLGCGGGRFRASFEADP